MSDKIYDISLDALYQMGDAVKNQLGVSADFTVYDIPDLLRPLKIDPTPGRNFIAAIVEDFDAEKILKGQVEGVTTIGPYAFAYVNLEYFEIPDSVEKICGYAFYHADYGAIHPYVEKTHIYVPSSVTVLEPYAFHNCKISVKLLGDYTNLPNHCFSNAYVDINSIAENCKSLSTIGDSCFEEVIEGFSKVDFANLTNLSKIGARAFHNTIVFDLYFPNSFFEIDNLAFANSHLDIVHLSNVIPQIKDDSFDNLGDTAVFLTAPEMFDEYRSDAQWSKYSQQILVDRKTPDGMFTHEVEVYWEGIGDAICDVYLTVNSNVLSGEYRYHMRTYYGDDSNSDLRSTQISPRLKIGERVYLNDIGFSPYRYTELDLEFFDGDNYYGVYENGITFNGRGGGYG